VDDVPTASRIRFHGGVGAHALAGWLAGLDGSALSAVLDRRPDVLLGRPPASLAQLAARLEEPASVVGALRGLPLPGLQVLEALQALGEQRSRDRLGTLLAGDPGPAHDQAVDAVLAELTGAALVRPGGGDRLEVPAGLATAFPRPLRLGPPARQLWSAQPVDALGRALRALGRRPAGRKADLLDALVEVLADGDAVRARVAQAPADVAYGLRRMADGTDDGGDPDEWSAHRFDPDRWAVRRAAERWGVDHGLLAAGPWGGGAEMPAEVARAVRGPGYRAPFTPDRPAVPTRPVADGVVGSGAAAAVGALTARALALLDRLARGPVPLLAGGGLGVRELGRLAKAVHTDETEMRLLVELTTSAGLVEPSSGSLGVGPGFSGFRGAEPVDQAVALLSAWWAFLGTPSASRDRDGKALPAARRRDPCAGCQAARAVLLGVLAALPAGRGADRAAVARAALWLRPMLHVAPEDAEQPLASVWKEAELLGTVVSGALSPLGAALLADDDAALRQALGTMLPPLVDRVSFGSDLTALVPGSPSARVADLLDGCADRESTGGAVTWRFSPASIRRALDAGARAAELVNRLAEVSERQLPQPLVFLVSDVGRRHGLLRVAPAVSVISSPDEALLAEVAADRRLAELGLHRIAPTVLGCAVPLEAALARLREVGYLPVPENGAAPGVLPPRARPVQEGRAGGGAARPVARRPAPEPVDTGGLAAELLQRGATADSAPESAVGRDLARAAAHLGPAELDRLTTAVEDGGRVLIDYVSGAGALTRRVICDPELDGDLLYAWCELRDDERVFAVSRILSVSPAT
jgi:Helicase conserved C-terminal domain